MDLPVAELPGVPPACRPRQVRSDEQDGGDAKRPCPALVEREEAGDGAGLDRLLEGERPALIVLDLMLPGEDGLSICRRLRAAAGPPVIMLSALGEEKDQVQGLALGADDYFLKPMDLQRLVSRVGALAGRALRRRPAGPVQLLLVDDDRSVHSLLESGLGGDRYELVHAYSVDEGLSKARLRAPALVVIDLLMDHAGGLRLALELRAKSETAAIPIVLVAGHDPSNEERAMLRSKALTLLSPGGGETLPQVLRRLLGSEMRATERSVEAV
ncbi:MAG TPA: response regulator [Thermoanaerobaculia bacterium]|nr:response regulator [Thermoanaerobaculia bacterium]